MTRPAEARRAQWIAEGSLGDRSVEGFSRCGSLGLHFQLQTLADRSGTLVEIVVRLPLPPLIGPLLKPLLEAQIRKELRAAAQVDRADIEQGVYPRPAARTPVAA